MRQDKATIKFENVTLDFEKENKFINLNLDILQGEKVFVTGQNDKNRTTLLYLILGVAKPSSGRVIVLDKNLKTLNKIKLFEIRKKIGYAHPQRGLLRNITVEENILLPARFNYSINYDFYKARYEKIIQKFDLSKYTDKLGWRLENIIEKRTLIARSIIHDPDILLLDEPTTYIEEKDKAEIKYLVDDVLPKEFLKETCSTIITTEDDDWAKLSADKNIDINTK
ncbi:MAG TPA: ATP-binding cassette domain-containing protein [Spirochaetota bacterium]|nr:ATP-binding cassette domain-containing protein [Spirochaetota bacterium]HOS31686.1 ATP-binding cassette domain-containing protein [Spirochaetota bacterium]HOS54980.1 ATP-binding cassette domain-containing protein [Spirochaetota bacterium]HQF78210.1 ATP-binding cassette domain-containing protein [Spirochaetota bacterium]HQJ06044.1 ATP-binding cassette domain-containing protein [Spirochaetota bacterium]